jgi:hypothetical protein
MMPALFRVCPPHHLRAGDSMITSLPGPRFLTATAVLAALDRGYTLFTNVLREGL